MATNRSTRIVTLFLLDILAYVLVVDFIAFCLGVLGKILVGGQWRIVEEIMFVFGVLLFGYATMLLWPTSIEDEEETRMDDPTPIGRIQRIVNGLPLFNKTSTRQLPESVKLFLASLVIIFTAFLIERLLIV